MWLRRRTGWLVFGLMVGPMLGCDGGVPHDPDALRPVVECLAPDARDQDSVTVWVHPTDPGRSTLIASDKVADRLFVYDLSGHVLQTVVTPKPGNVDVRRGFPLGGERIDILAFNQREAGLGIRVYRIDPETRRIERVDRGDASGQGEGGTLYHSRATDRFYYVMTSNLGVVTQYELTDDGSGRVASRPVRQWMAGRCEGAIADDRTGRLYIAAETRGIWELGAEPTDPTPGRLVARTGEHGLVPDVEGLTIYPVGDEDGYLIASNQNRHNFKVYRLGGEFDFLGTFRVQGAEGTDGVAAVETDLGPPWENGLFACHTGVGRCPVLVVPWPARAAGDGGDAAGPRRTIRHPARPD